MWHKICFVAGLALASTAWAKNIESMSFSHESWELVCSNIGTCQAAGYGQGEDAPASILLQRPAGKNSAVTALWVLGNQDDWFAVEQKKGERIDFFVQGKNMGQVNVTDTSVGLGGVFNAAQKNAVLAAIKQQGDFEFKSGDAHWAVSSQGMAAVLLKMDAFQNRVGTVGALVQKGSKDERQVLLPQGKRVIRQVATANKPYLTLKPTDAAYGALKAKLAQNNQCEGLDHEWEGIAEHKEIELYRLNANKSLAKALCWRGAYNEGYGIWVMDASLQGKATWVTDSATYVSSGEILASHKGRGAGDCWSLGQWVWDGKAFVQSQDMTTGQCAGIAIGGTWLLNFLETDVIRSGAKTK